MNSTNIRLGSILGIPILLHSTTLWFLGGIGIFIGLEAAVATAIVLSIVLLHELGHSIAARRYRIDVLKITIYPFGGMAYMSMIPERPEEELVVALAGPATNFVLALPGLLYLALVGDFSMVSIGTAPLTALASYWTWINIVLGTFNLLPAFPMDGGRVLRAALVRRLGYLGATEFAVRVGRWIAAALLLWALFGPGFFLGPLFIAIFIWVMGGRELFAVRLRHATPFGGAAGAGDLGEMLRRMFAGAQGGSPFPGAPPGFGGAPGAHPEREAAPRDVEIVVEPKSHKGGFSEQEIRRLESFHGRLPRDPSAD